jgi:hypothetical protein
MKMAKSIGFFAAGILALLPAGCFNPVTAALPKTEEPPSPGGRTLFRRHIHRE